MSLAFRGRRQGRQPLNNQETQLGFDFDCFTTSSAILHPSERPKSMSNPEAFWYLLISILRPWFDVWNQKNVFTQESDGGVGNSPWCYADTPMISKGQAHVSQRLKKTNGKYAPTLNPRSLFYAYPIIYPIICVRSLMKWGWAKYFAGDGPYSSHAIHGTNGRWAYYGNIMLPKPYMDIYGASRVIHTYTYTIIYI